MFYSIEKELVVSVQKKHIPWIFLPFVGLWDLVAWIIGLTGRLIAVVLGLVFLVVGVILTITVVGAIIGIPLIIIGFLLVLRGLW